MIQYFRLYTNAGKVVVKCFIKNKKTDLKKIKFFIILIFKVIITRNQRYGGCRFEANV
jgi:hypothetical protein